MSLENTIRKHMIESINTPVDQTIAGMSPSAIKLLLKHGGHSNDCQRFKPDCQCGWENDGSIMGIKHKLTKALENKK